MGQRHAGLGERAQVQRRRDPGCAVRAMLEGGVHVRRQQRPAVKHRNAAHQRQHDGSFDAEHVLRRHAANDAAARPPIRPPRPASRRAASTCAPRANWPRVLICGSGVPVLPEVYRRSKGASRSGVHASEASDGAEDCACGEWTMQRACSAQCGCSSLASSTTMTGSAADLRMASRSACPPEGGSSCRQPRRKAASHVTRKPTRELHRLQTVRRRLRGAAPGPQTRHALRARSSRGHRRSRRDCPDARRPPAAACLSGAACQRRSGVRLRRPPDTPGITNLLYQARKGLAREEVRAQPVFAHKEHGAAQQDQHTRPRDSSRRGTAEISAAITK